MIESIAHCMSMVRDIVIAGAAIYGVNKWWTQLKGKAEYELAKEVLKAVYRVREAFKYVRQPFTWSFEYPENMRDPSGHLKREFEYEGTKHVYQNRWKLLQDAFEKLGEKHLEAQVEFGSQYHEVIVPLFRCYTKLEAAIADLLESRKPGRAYSESSDELAERQSTLYYLGETPNKHDKFTPEINAAIKKFEDWLRPYVENRKKERILVWKRF
jgi:hypothetical protein